MASAYLKNRIFVLPSAIINHFRDNIGNKAHATLTLNNVNNVIKGLITADPLYTKERYILPSRNDLGQQRWKELDKNLLLDAALQAGWKCATLQSIVNGTYEPTKIIQVKSAPPVQFNRIDNLGLN